MKSWAKVLFRSTAKALQMIEASRLFDGKNWLVLSAQYVLAGKSRFWHVWGETIKAGGPLYCRSIYVFFSQSVWNTKVIDSKPPCLCPTMPGLAYSQKKEYTSLAAHWKTCDSLGEYPWITHRNHVEVSWNEEVEEVSLFLWRMPCFAFFSVITRSTGQPPASQQVYTLIHICVSCLRQSAAFGLPQHSQTSEEELS